MVIFCIEIYWNDAIVWYAVLMHVEKPCSWRQPHDTHVSFPEKLASWPTPFPMTLSPWRTRCRSHQGGPGKSPGKPSSYRSQDHICLCHKLYQPIFHLPRSTWCPNLTLNLPSTSRNYIPSYPIFQGQLLAYKPVHKMLKKISKNYTSRTWECCRLASLWY